MNIVPFIALILFTSCHAQTVKSLLDDEYAAVNGAYYKDTYNDLDNYLGTWMYINGNTSLTISIQKRAMLPSSFGNIKFFEDILVGGYRYVEDGIEKVNTLPQLSLNLSPSQYYIFGNTIVGPNSQYCLNCGPNDKKMILEFSDPNRDIFGFEPEMIFQRADEGGVQKIKLKFRTISGSLPGMNGEQPMYKSYTIPFGEYILVKQP